MTLRWHPDVDLEVAVEFQRLQGGLQFERLVDALWSKQQRESRAWSDHGQWWRRTTTGQRYQRAYARAQHRRLKATVVAVRGCAVCGTPFELTAYRQRRDYDRVCSPRCRGAARKNIRLVTIDGVSKPLVRWAEEHGRNVGLVWARIARGWDVKRALSAPAANRRSAIGRGCLRGGDG